MRMGWGTGRRPTSVPCCRNLRISDSSVKPLRMTTTFISHGSKTTMKGTKTTSHRGLRINAPTFWLDGNLTLGLRFVVTEIWWTLIFEYLPASCCIVLRTIRRINLITYLLCINWQLFSQDTGDSLILGSKVLDFDWHWALNWNHKGPSMLLCCTSSLWVKYYSLIFVLKEKTKESNNG